MFVDVEPTLAFEVIADSLQHITVVFEHPLKEAIATGIVCKYNAFMISLKIKSCMKEHTFNTSTMTR